jgi:hypothetical protein
MTDSFGNSAQAFAPVGTSNMEQIEATLTYTPNIDNGTIASVCAQVTGGSGTYEFIYGPADEANWTETLDSCFVDLSFGTYSLQINDPNSACDLDTTFVVSEPCILDGDWSSTAVTCPGYSNGQICCDTLWGAVPGEGIGPYTCSILPALGNYNEATNCFENLPEGIYTVTTISQDGCYGVFYNLPIPSANDPIQVSSASDPSYTDIPSGSICVDIAGGTGSFSANVVNTNSTEIYPLENECATSLVAGEYEILVTDLNSGCQQVVSILVDTITFSAEQFTEIIPCGASPDCSGTCSFEISGSPPFLFFFNGIDDEINMASSNDTIVVFSSLCSGDYPYMISDNHGHSETGIITITAPTAVMLNVVEVLQDDGNSSGSITIQLEGGTPPYSVYWNNESGDTTISGLSAGTYNPEVFDANGCYYAYNGIDVPLANQIDKPRQKEFGLFPNPFTTGVYLQGNGYNGFVKVKDISGKTMIIQKLTSAMTYLELSMLLPGHYIVEIITNQGTIQHHHIIKME